MNNKLIVVADLGALKAYRVSKDHMSAFTHVELIEEREVSDAHTKLADKVSDKAGRFPGANGSASGAMSAGENHNLQSETTRRLVRNLADSINAIVQRENPEQWYFAAAREVNGKVVADLEPKVRARLTKNIGADLVKVSKAELLEHF